MSLRLQRDDDNDGSARYNDNRPARDHHDGSTRDHDDGSTRDHDDGSTGDHNHRCTCCDDHKRSAHLDNRSAHLDNGSAHLDHNRSAHYLDNWHARGRPVSLFDDDLGACGITARRIRDRCH